jgi:hypothetical protein
MKTVAALLIGFVLALALSARPVAADSPSIERYLERIALALEAQNRILERTHR